MHFCPLDELGSCRFFVLTTLLGVIAHKLKKTHGFEEFWEVQVGLDFANLERFLLDLINETRLEKAGKRLEMELGCDFG